MARIPQSPLGERVKEIGKKDGVNFQAKRLVMAEFPLGRATKLVKQSVSLGRTVIVISRVLILVVIVSDEY